MSPSNYQRITSAAGQLLASTIQDALWRAGIPSDVRNADTGSSLDVLVPCAQADHARSLLFPERRSGEIYYVPARRMK